MAPLGPGGAVPLTVHYLYRVFDADGRLLYIGTTTDWRKRLRRHVRHHALWTSHYALVDVDILVGVTSTKAAQDAEREAINVENPWYNVIGQHPYRDPGPMPRGALAAQSRALASHKRLSLGDRL